MDVRGDDRKAAGMFSYVRLEERVPQGHPLRTIRALVDAVLSELSPEFEKLYSRVGRPSIPPEHLLRALLLQAFYTVRSERLLMEQLDYNLLFRWFVGLSMDDAVWDASSPPPVGGGRNAERDFHGEKRSNETHASTTDPDARLFRKGQGKEAKLCHMGHILTENRNGLIVDARLTAASGTAECTTALALIEDNVGAGGTLGADKNYDTAGFVAGCRVLGCVPHVAQNTSNRRSAIDARTTRHPGYAVSMIKRKRIEEPFGWMKTVGGLRKTRHRGRALVEWFFVFTAAAYNLIRIPKLLAVG